jgi:hypothetical protein
MVEALTVSQKDWVEMASWHADYFAARATLARAPAPSVKRQHSGAETHGRALCS